MAQGERPHKTFAHHEEDEGIMGHRYGLRVYNQDTSKGLHVGVGPRTSEIDPENSIRGRKYGLRIGRLAVGFGPKIDKKIL